KYKQAFTARPTTPLGIATNNMPRFSDKSDGLWRRMLLLPFVGPNSGRNAVQGMDQGERWKNSGELPRLFHWAIAGLIDLRNEGGFTIPQSCKAAVDGVRLECNPTRIFLQEGYREVVDGHVFKQLMYRQYTEWCKDRNYKPFADGSFGKEVRRVFR